MLTLMVVIAAYVLGALGLSTIAKIRRIQHGWLAWVPVGNAWLLGRISDQYQMVKNENKTHRGAVLLVLNILYGLSTAVLSVLCVIMIVQLIVVSGVEFAEMAQGSGAMYNGEMPAEVMGVLTAVIGAYVVQMLSMIPMLIMQYIALYDLFQSCDPSSSVVYLLLSIFLGISPFLVFVCRYRDYGMPKKNMPQTDEQTDRPQKPARPKQVPW